MNSELPDRPATPRLAATVILLRESAGTLETLMLRRVATMAFAAGEWVFPGGAIDAEDGSERMQARIAQPDPRVFAPLRRTAWGEPLDATVALSLIVAACRETFEEAGVLLARHGDGRVIDPALVSAWQADRARHASEPGGFLTFLEQNDLVLELDRIAYWSNWITPSYVPRRFDTRFFLAPMPPGQSIDASGGESQESKWVPLIGRGSAPASIPVLEPPVVPMPAGCTLAELACEFARQGSIEALFAHSKRIEPLGMMIKIKRDGDETFSLMPWDPEYASTPGQGVVCNDALVHRLGEFPSRFKVDFAAVKKRSPS